MAPTGACWAGRPAGRQDGELNTLALLSRYICIELWPPWFVHSNVFWVLITLCCRTQHDTACDIILFALRRGDTSYDTLRYSVELHFIRSLLNSMCVCDVLAVIGWWDFCEQCVLRSEYLQASLCCCLYCLMVLLQLLHPGRLP